MMSDMLSYADWWAIMQIYADYEIDGRLCRFMDNDEQLYLAMASDTTSSAMWK